MKKILVVFLALIGMFMFTGCEKVQENGIYKEGTYFGAVTYESQGDNFVTTAVVYVDSNGMIKSVFIDSIYNKDSVNTTKKTLGDNYGMKGTSANIGNISGGAEWYEQVKKIEDKIVLEQGLDWVKWSNDSSTKLDLDTISGVTINSDSYIEAVSIALSQAK